MKSLKVKDKNPELICCRCSKYFSGNRFIRIDGYRFCYDCGKINIWDLTEELHRKNGNHFYLEDRTNRSKAWKDKQKNAETQTG